MPDVVIVGAGVAGVQTALELRHRGFSGSITLLSAEHVEPYDRPPLSKEFLKGSVEAEAICLLPSNIAADKGIDVRLSTEVAEIRRNNRELLLSDGSTTTYDHLVLATGARNRALTVPGADSSVVYLRSLEEAHDLRRQLTGSSRIVIVGGGFIGLEVAAAAHAAGAHVTVVEFLPRVMARALSEEMAAHFTNEHQRRGVDLLTGVGVTEVLADTEGNIRGVRLTDESILDADLVVVGVGVSPCTELAESAGLDVFDGVIVDAQLRTSDPLIFAIGDCARFECVVSGRGLRLESIQNAADQARFVADLLADLARTDQAGSEQVGEDHSKGALSYSALPWFWSEQYDSKLQIAGAAPPDAISVVRGDPGSGSFSVCRFVGGRLVAVESVNRPRDHIAARKLLAATADRTSRVTPEAVADDGVALKDLLD